MGDVTVNAIYCKDINGFLSRRRVEELRVVSRRFNSTVLCTPSSILPRFVCRKLELSVVGLL